MIVAELQRQKKKELSDEIVIKILKKLKKSEIESIEAQGFDLKDTTSSYILTLDIYLPKEATVEEIESWIVNNIKFADYKNKMQAMKPIIEHFAGRVDGKKVKEILEKIK